MLFRGVLQASVLFGVRALVQWSQSSQPQQQQQQQHASSDDADSIAPLEPTSSTTSSVGGTAAAASIPAGTMLSSAQAWLADPRNTIIVGGLELGAW